jgi:hypothetical protein
MKGGIEMREKLEEIYIILCRALKELERENVFEFEDNRKGLDMVSIAKSMLGEVLAELADKSEV